MARTVRFHLDWRPPNCSRRPRSSKRKWKPGLPATTQASLRDQPSGKGRFGDLPAFCQTSLPTVSRLLSALAAPASSASISRSSLLSVLLRQTAQATPAMQINPTR